MKIRQFLPLFSLCTLAFSTALSSCAPVKNSSTTPASSTRNLAQPSKIMDVWTKRRAIYDVNRRAPLELKSISRAQNSAATVEKMTIRGVGGDVVPFYIVSPLGATAQNRAPGIVLVHGLTQNIDQMLFAAQFYAAQGYASVIPEIVNHGERMKAGHALFGSDVASLRADAIQSVGDIRRTLDVFAARPNIDSQRIGLIGLSLGSILGSITTALDNRIQTAIFAVGGADWRTILSTSQISSDKTKAEARQLNAQQIALLDDVDPKNFVGKIAPRPVLMLNGKRDTIIPVAAAKAFYNAAGQPKKQIWFDAGHFLPVMEVAIPINDWLEQHLKKPAATTVALRK